MTLEFTGDDGGGGGGGGGVGLPGSTIGLLPPGAQTDKLALLEAAIGKPVPLAFGLHLVGGNVILNEEVANGERVLFIALGEGEWDGIEALFVNGKLYDHTDTARVHFHPGLDGETGTETDPAVRNQKICSLWPSSFADKFTFSRTAYLALKLAPDPAAPDAMPRVIGIYRTRKVRIFDSGGTQTAFQYSKNPADIYIDLLVSAFVKPRGLINEALTAGEKAFFDFVQRATFATDCNVSTPQGTTRFEAHPAFYSSTDLLRALELLFLLSRAYHLEKAGKFAPFMNKARSSLLTLGPNDFAPGSFSVGERDTRDAANKYLGKFRNLHAGKGAGTMATTGTAVTGTSTKFLKWFRAGSPVRLLDGAQAGQVRKVLSVASDTAMTLVTAFSADQSGRAYSNPELQLSKSEKYVEDETHQTEVGRVLTLELDLHNQIPERAERILKYTKAKALDVVKQTGLRALWIPGVLDLLPGDVFTAPGKWDFYDAANNQDWDLLKLVINQNMTFELGGEEYDAALYSDAAGAQQDIVPSLPGTGLAPITTVDGSGAQHIDLAGAVITNKNADNIAEATTRKWAGESGADVTGAHTAGDTAAVAGLAAARVPEVLFDDAGVGKIKAVKFVAANPGAVSGGKLLASGSTSSETDAWIVLSTVDVDVPAGVASLTIQLAASLTGSGTLGYGTSPPFGASIHNGSPPATPQVTRATTPGPVTFTNPVGNKLTIYAKGNSTGINFELTLNATQDVSIPLRVGSVT